MNKELEKVWVSIGLREQRCPVTETRCFLFCDSLLDLLKDIGQRKEYVNTICPDCIRLHENDKAIADGIKLRYGKNRYL